MADKGKEHQDKRHDKQPNPEAHPHPSNHHHDRRESKGTQKSGGSGKSIENENSKDIYFIIPRTVTVLYGPYMFQGMMDYRTERLQGIKTFLEKLGVTVNLTPCLDHVNLCRVWFLDELIFSCKITDLMYGGDGELDSLCLQAAECLEKFIKKVLKGLRKQKPEMTPEQLKKPFCPCFQIDHSGHKNRRKSQEKRLSEDGSSRSGGSSRSRGSGSVRGQEEGSVDGHKKLTPLMMPKHK